MNSKERVRNALQCKACDRVPAHFNATAFVIDELKKTLGLADIEDVLKHFEIDTRTIGARYVGPTLTKREIGNNSSESENMFGSWVRSLWNGKEHNSTVFSHVLENIETAEDVVKMARWPKKEWFDFSKISEQLDRHEDKAIMFGHWGPFQTATDLRPEEKLYMDMAANPEVAAKIFDKMHEFQMWYYREIFEAGKGRIDILRTHDDYGTQKSMLFSTSMWKEYFEKHTKELTALAHEYNAFFWQHSCGAIRPIIPELIAAGIDALEPLQPVAGMDPEGLSHDFHGKVCFVGGIDTQHLLPFGSPKEVKKEVRRYIDVLGKNGGGYILYPSQAWESCVPVHNIEALYSLR
jgi:uroporphyrinogen decarboxylase